VPRCLENSGIWIMHWTGMFWCHLSLEKFAVAKIFDVFQIWKSKMATRMLFLIFSS
jgi:hypothetical protein